MYLENFYFLLSKVKNQNKLVQIKFKKNRLQNKDSKTRIKNVNKINFKAIIQCWIEMIKENSCSGPNSMALFIKSIELLK